MRISEVLDYLDCPRMHYFSWVRNLTPTEPSAKLVIGSGVHQAIARYYKEKADPAQAFEEWASVEVARIVERTNGLWPEQIAALQKDVATMAKVLKNYPSWAVQEDEHYRMEYVEEQFAIPLEGDGLRDVYHVGTIDSIACDMYGRVWIIERKTARDFRNPVLIELDIQVGSYILAAYQIFADRPVAGAIFEEIRKVDPAKTKQGLFCRTPTTRTVRELASLQEMLARIVPLLDKNDGWLYSPKLQCTWKCAYRELCFAMNRGENIDSYVGSLFTLKEPGVYDTDEEVA